MLSVTYGVNRFKAYLQSLLPQNVYRSTTKILSQSTGSSSYSTVLEGTIEEGRGSRGSSYFLHVSLDRYATSAIGSSQSS